jgi:hypothetical protein
VRSIHPESSPCRVFFACARNTGWFSNPVPPLGVIGRTQRMLIDRCRNTEVLSRALRSGNRQRGPAGWESAIGQVFNNLNSKTIREVRWGVNGRVGSAARFEIRIGTGPSLQLPPTCVWRSSRSDCPTIHPARHIPSSTFSLREKPPCYTPSPAAGCCRKQSRKSNFPPTLPKERTTRLVFV